jgi:protein-L-isoaspartate(D-aspartate) O-methyltransferase
MARSLTMKAVFAILISMMLGLPSVGAECRPGDETFLNARRQMVAQQIRARGIKDARVLAAMTAVPRHCFVPVDLRDQAYSDHPLPIGEGQTISQPYIVALMTATLKLDGDETVLEVGTGSGYQAAVLAALAARVVTVEIKANLHARASEALQSLGDDNVTAIAGDGYYGWKPAAPFDAIMITAAVDHVPPPLLAQLKEGGRLILPLGNPFSFQNLVLVTKTGGTLTTDQITGVLFVPMTGAALNPRP